MAFTVDQDCSALLEHAAKYLTNENFMDLQAAVLFDIIFPSIDSFFWKITIKTWRPAGCGCPKLLSKIH